MHYVYVLLSLKVNNWFYVGFTNDLTNRLKRHNSGLVKSTSFYAPLKLIYYEAYGSEKDARIREKNLKGHQQRDLLKEKIKNSLNL
jgi:putative endonuclease